MLVFDQLKKNDPHLPWLVMTVAAGLMVLVAGLWWIQIVSARDYQANLEMQSFRTVRIPAVRGKILDRSGNVLAENRATYNVSLYLEELRKPFSTTVSAELGQARKILRQQREAEEKRLKRSLNKKEARAFTLTQAQREELEKKARFEVASNVIAKISGILQIPYTLNPTNFHRHYEQSLALPFPVFTNLTQVQIGQFQEQCSSLLGLDIEMQSIRIYPYQTNAAHILGSVKHDDSSAEGEESYFSYRLPDYRGQLGVEVACDRELRGKAGAKSVLVNSAGFRQTENVWAAAEPGNNVVLTIDLKLQQRAERALQVFGPTTRGALVVMEVESGDILAIASCPTINPNDSVQGLSVAEAQRRLDPRLRPERNRATQENYAPGSIYKTVTGMACLEAGIDPNEFIHNSGYAYVGSHPIRDLAPPGQYDFRKALMHSSNTYFITNGLRIGIEPIIRLSERLHLGERFGLQTRQETPGRLPSLEKVRSPSWHNGDTANLCIGQGPIDVTPLQMTVMMAAIANGGKVLWPRLIDRIEPQDTLTGGPPQRRPSGQVHDELQVKPRTLQIVRDAMLADVEGDGTGTKARVEGLRICGKTGTAQVMDEHNRTVGETVWFASFAPYENPRYAVVIMVETGANEGSGGGTCAPIAANVYRALLDRQRAINTKGQTASLN
jgi:penicillin-binding protein 2